MWISPLLCLGRKSLHQFDNPEEEASSLIYNYTPIYAGNFTSYQQLYFFWDPPVSDSDCVSHCACATQHTLYSLWCNITLHCRTEPLNAQISKQKPDLAICMQIHWGYSSAQALKVLPTSNNYCYTLMCCYCCFLCMNKPRFRWTGLEHPWLIFKQIKIMSFVLVYMNFIGWLQISVFFLHSIFIQFIGLL